MLAIATLEIIRSELLPSVFFTCVYLCLAAVCNALAHVDVILLQFRSGIAYTAVDYETPGRIQRSLESFRRCGTDEPQPLPNSGRKCKFSMTVNWSSFFHEEPCFCEGISYVMHLPFYPDASIKKLPSNLSILKLFTIAPKGKGEEKRLGAYVVAPRSVWSTIDESGIVEEYISSFRENGGTVGGEESSSS
jgi:hypothetical protein